MKILSLHCDYIRFKPLKKALNKPEDLDEKRKKGEEIKEPLVILTAIEKVLATDSGVAKTPDLGGKGQTYDLGNAIVQALS